LYSCGFGEPIEGYNATFKQAKSTEKARFPQVSLDFMPILPIFA
jgi:hypothetical protein